MHCQADAIVDRVAGREFPDVQRNVFSCFLQRRSNLANDRARRTELRALFERLSEYEAQEMAPAP